MFGRGRLACSFRGRGEAEVVKLEAGPRIPRAGPRVYIRDRCIAASNQIMEQHAGGEPQNPEHRHGVLAWVFRGISRAARWPGPRCRVV